MRVLETYDVLGHEVHIVMDSTSPDLKEFSCLMTVDNKKARISNCGFYNEETLNPEKILKEVIEESLNYVKNPSLGQFIQNNNFNGSEQEINAGDMVFRAAKNSHDWLIDNFTKEEIKELYKAIEPDLDLDSIKNEVFLKKDVFFNNTTHDDESLNVNEESLENEDYDDLEL